MKRGKTQAETLHLNDWSIGDILEGTEVTHGIGLQLYTVTNRILITCIGDDEFLCKWDYNDGKGFDRPETGNTTLFCREWKKVGEDAERKSRASFWGRVAHRLTRKKVNLRKALQDILLFRGTGMGGMAQVQEIAEKALRDNP
jgi:hypothetical protein